ncbi:prolipoprotein diacylglyceryl transferase [Patescibacteria group bacterium]|nr:prolipoprotein diacylglyceryl transferase [Patescibacteria group bacterium]MBU1705195.1 prolipoprotein diacylglyceryl transferase [Patescibacteria group bacterium]
MIPYFTATTFHLGPIPIQVWGTLVALGILAGTFASAWLAKQRKQDAGLIWDLATWVILGAFVMARVFHVWLYNFDYYAADPTKIFVIWEGGWSIIGGFLGAVLAGAWYLKKRQVNFGEYADTTIFGLPLGLFIGRIGCFLIHDHPGKITNFFLGVQYPDGIIRHDHGLYLSLSGLGLFAAYLIMWKLKIEKGLLLPVFLLWYGAVRFVLDFYRATDGLIVDARYWGLTPAQFASLFMIVLGITLLIRKRKHI